MATPTNLPAAQTTGAVLTAAYMNDLRGAFRVLQVVQGTTSTSVSNSTSTFADTGLTATITPQSATNKILVIVAQQGGTKSAANDQNRIALRLMRGATAISSIAGSAGYTNTALQLRIATCTGVYLDSPSTTSATTYKTQFNNVANDASVSFQIDSENSTITLIEISA
jgi:hypothetical protein